MRKKARPKQFKLRLTSTGSLFSILLCFQLFIIEVAFAKPEDNAPEAKETVSELVRGFLGALKTGNVVALRDYIGGDLAVRMRPLLHENGDYPEFLRNHHTDVKFSIADISVTKETAIARIESHFPGQVSQIFILNVTQDNFGSWKITNQTLAR